MALVCIKGVALFGTRLRWAALTRMMLSVDTAFYYVCMYIDFRCTLFLKSGNAFTRAFWSSK